MLQRLDHRTRFHHVVFLKPKNKHVDVHVHCYAFELTCMYTYMYMYLYVHVYICKRRVLAYFCFHRRSSCSISSGVSKSSLNISAASLMLPSVEHRMIGVKASSDVATRAKPETKNMSHHIYSATCKHVCIKHINEHVTVIIPSNLDSRFSITWSRNGIARLHR